MPKGVRGCRPAPLSLSPYPLGQYPIALSPSVIPMLLPGRRALHALLKDPVRKLEKTFLLS